LFSLYNSGKAIYQSNKYKNGVSQQKKKKKKKEKGKLQKWIEQP